MALPHHLPQLLLDEPGGIPFDVQLTGQFEAGDVVLGSRHQVHRQKPLRQRRARFMEDRTCPCRRLKTAGRALKETLWRAIAMRAARAFRAHEPLRPPHPHQGGVALVLVAVTPVELGHAKSPLELYLIARHRCLPRRRSSPVYQGFVAERRKHRGNQVFLSNPARLLLEPVLALLAQTLRCPQVRWIWAVGHHCNDVVSGKRRMTGDIQDITERNGSRGRSAGFGDALTWRRRRLAAGNLSSRSTSGSSSLVERSRTRGQGVERAKCCQRLSAPNACG